MTHPLGGGLLDDDKTVALSCSMTNLCLRDGSHELDDAVGDGLLELESALLA